MQILQNGSFTFSIQPEELARGLRPSRRSPRNVKYLVQCEGAVGYDNVLQVLDDLNINIVDTSAIVDGFPYPQLFVFNNVIIVCGESDIYELVAGALVHQLAVTPGIRWSAVDLNDYVYMSNGVISVIRRAEDQVWALTTDLPIASAICNFNGQIVIGAPDVDRS